MKIILVTNRISKHQVPLCNALYETPGIEFRLIETLKNTESWHVGWSADSTAYPYVERAETVYEDLARIIKLINSADVVVTGSAPDSFVLERLKSGKLTFRYSERFYKQGLNWKNYLHVLIGAWLHHGRFQKYPLYMLCASAYTAADGARFHNYLNRCYKWGYFPELFNYESIEQVIAKKDPRLIVWAARQIDWKHPETAIEVANRLKQKGISFHLNMIGSGEMSDELVAMVGQLELTEYVTFLGSMTPEEVRNQMEQAGIFLFTSDFQEGWGAVANEAMNSGCAVVASHAIGSVPFLIQDGTNGYIYENGNIDSIHQKVEFLLNHSEKQKEFGRNAYSTIHEQWNANVAAERLICLCQALLNGDSEPHLYEDGPCSIAELISNNWYKN